MIPRPGRASFFMKCNLPWYVQIDELNSLVSAAVQATRTDLGRDVAHPPSADPSVALTLGFRSHVTIRALSTHIRLDAARLTVHVGVVASCEPRSATCSGRTERVPYHVDLALQSPVDCLWPT
jgi:hypothetical protein